MIDKKSNLDRLVFSWLLPIENQNEELVCPFPVEVFDDLAKNFNFNVIARYNIMPMIIVDIESTMLSSVKNYASEKYGDAVYIDKPKSSSFRYYSSPILL